MKKRTKLEGSHCELTIEVTIVKQCSTDIRIDININKIKLIANKLMFTFMVN